MRIIIETLGVSVDSNQFVADMLYLAATEFDPLNSENPKAKKLAPIDYSFNTKLDGLDTRIRIKLEDV